MKRSRGLSLIELLVVLMVLGVLVALATLGVTVALQKARQVSASTEKEVIQRALSAYMIQNSLVVVPTPASCVTDFATSSPALYPSLLSKAQPGGGRGYLWDSEGNVSACSGGAATAPTWAEARIIGRGDIPGASGAGEGYRVQAVGSSALVLRANSSSLPNLALLDVSTPILPSLQSEADVAVGSNGDVYVSGGYAYLAGSDKNSELTIVSLSDPGKMQVVGTCDLPGNGAAHAVTVRGTYAYVVRNSSSHNPEFCVIDVTKPAHPTLVGGCDLGAHGLELTLAGSFAYVGTATDSSEVKVVDISSPTKARLVALYNTPGNDNALSLAAVGNTLLVGTQDGLLLKLDISVPGVPVLRGSFAAGGAVQDIALGDGLAFLAVDRHSATGQVQILDYGDDTPTLIGAVVFDGDAKGADANGIAYSDSLDALLVATTSHTSELLVVGP